ncbi:phage tail tape measure protein [Methylobacterium sp. sgz302541]|uniref:phage tail tape measure protein n=1 Tax=unclassified Methylobacterium TaxID=2615210 RepID=UPI003D32967E
MAETETALADAGRIRQLDTLDKLAQKFGQSLSKALTGNLGAGRQLDSVLNSLGTRLSALAVRTALTPVRTGITSLVNNLLSTSTDSATAFAHGGVIAGGRVRPFAEGGVVASPTYFPMRDGTGLAGEAGPEAILPLKRGSDGRLGVAAGGNARPVSVTVNIATPDVAGFRKSESQVAAGLARAVARGQRAL